MVYFKENYNFPRFQRWSNISKGEGVSPTFSRGSYSRGSYCLFPIGIHITCDFSKGCLVRGDRDSRATLMPIYGDLYQIKL